MQCPFCGVDEDRVIDSRTIGEGNAIRRRRKCLACGKRFTTYERPEATPRLCIKKDGSHELFSREKILSGMIKACHKRNISLHDLEGVAAKIESEIFEEYDSEVSTKVIGEKVSEALKGIDHVAFVRFASVYREFKDVGEFLKELLPLVHPTALPLVHPTALPLVHPTGLPLVNPTGLPLSIPSQVATPPGPPPASHQPGGPRPARGQETREPRGKKGP